MLDIPKMCTACSACINICPKKCITMITDANGFLYPVIDTGSCVECHKCEKVCPIVNDVKVSLSSSAMALKSKINTERENSSSGGAFPLLADHILKEGGAVYGAAYASEFSVHHICIENKKELSLLQGAKYVQSEVGISFSNVKKQLNIGQKVLFSGTPCQCMGLQCYLDKKYDNLILVDTICHGVPSPKVWQTYIDYRSTNENDGKRPIRINMRSKSSGWSRYSYSTEFDYGNGNISRIRNGQDVFMQAFIGNICLRDSCSECKAKGVNRCTDLTLGDYWGIWNQHPEFDDNKGTSVVFIHSEKGQSLINQIQDKIEYFDVKLNDAYQENRSFIYSSYPHEKREEFLANVNKDNFALLVQKYFSQREDKRNSLLKKILMNIKRILR